MAKHYISFADKNLLQSVVTPEVLSPLVPRIGEIADAVANMKSMQQEITTLGQYHKSAGFTAGRAMQRVAWIPASVRAAVVLVEPDAFTNKKKFYELLAGPLKAYDLRGHVSL
jgi:hypothetical protein